ncbi:MAG TPA: leucine-rich repeat domain-containing protein [Clostridia bacterium]|jgi:hypothetical protein|nr:MAG: hypothetical protein BWX97_00810 [Firmicutes bacterium ADurb.Bin146]HOD93311.1 leucine-rich repeat domain-containing protein [Clostridia bacterium]HQM39363.1 leucine-rich repeat domain-containing protein [Clostridia bacterium]
MRRNFKIIIIVLMLVLTAGIFTSCSDTKETLFSINIINGKEVHITKYHGKSNRISVPAEIKGLPVTGISSNAFWGNTEAKSISLPDSVKVIGNNAFYSCKSITSFNIPKSLKELGENAFIGCDKLKDITITEGNEFFFVKDGVLFNKDMTKLIIYPPQKNGKEYIIPSSVTHLDKNSFFNNINISQITLPSGLIEIGPTAFKNCSSITQIEIPEGVTSIRAGAFWDCSNLTTIKIPNSVNSISDQVFYGCAKLSSIYVKQGSYAHKWCEDNSRTSVMKFY